MLTQCGLVAGMWIEDPGALSSGNSRLLMIFVGIVALSMLTQAIIVVAFAVGAMKMNKKLLALAQELHHKAMPVIGSAETLFRETSPKVKIITDNLVETSHMVRAKTQEITATIADVNIKTKVQVSRVDSMVTTALARTAALGEILHDGIRAPAKQVAGVFTGVRVGLETFLSKTKHMGTSNGQTGPVIRTGREL